jgi:hypothetical protein
VEASKKLSTSP